MQNPETTKRVERKLGPRAKLHSPDSELTAPLLVLSFLEAPMIAGSREGPSHGAPAAIAGAPSLLCFGVFLASLIKAKQFFGAI